MDDVAGFQAFDGFSEVGDGADFLAIDGDDQVSRASVEAFEDERASALTEQGGAFYAGLLGRTVGSQAFDQKAFFGFEDSLDADFCAVDSAVSDKFGNDSRDKIHWDGETDSGALSCSAGDGCVDADQSAVQIEQRATGVAWVDRRVDLDDRFDRPVFLDLDRAIQAGDDAGRQCSFQLKRVADREDSHTDFQLVRIAHRDGKQNVVWSVDFDNGDVVGRVVTDDAGFVGLAVVKRDADVASVRDDVPVRDDVAGAVDDRSRACSFGSLLGEKERVDSRASCRDINDAFVKLVVD